MSGREVGALILSVLMLLVLLAISGVLWVLFIRWAVSL